MCCAIAVLGLIGPRTLIFFWWLVDPARWSLVFDGLLVPLLGFLFLPWTTLAYVALWAAGGLSALGWLLVVLAFLIDIGSFGGGYFGNRGRMSSYRE